MFAQFIIVLLLLVFAGWVAWRYILAPRFDIHHGKAPEAQKRAQQKVQEAVNVEAEVNAVEAEVKAKKKIAKAKDRIRFLKKRK
jgi:hypothetical protein